MKKKIDNFTQLLHNNIYKLQTGERMFMDKNLVKAKLNSKITFERSNQEIIVNKGTEILVDMGSGTDIFVCLIGQDHVDVSINEFTINNQN